jgi:hypothetical protein
MGAFYANVIHQMVQRCFHRIQFRERSCLTDLADMSAVPISYFGLHLVELAVEFIEPAGDFGTVSLILFGVDVLSRFEDLIRLTVSTGEARIVPVVVVQVEAQFVGKPL